MPGGDYRLEFTVSPDTTGSNNSRRSFLMKLGLGTAALAGVTTGLIKFSQKPTPKLTQEFPGPDSIFHPATDPRQDPRRA